MIREDTNFFNILSSITKPIIGNLIGIIFIFHADIIHIKFYG
jgi:hypothetical protein